MTNKVFLIKNQTGEDFYIDPADHPCLNLTGGEKVDRNDPKVEQYFSSLERILERARLIRFSKDAMQFFKVK